MKHTRESIVAIICECRKNGTDIVLQGADLSGLDLRGLDLRWADLQKANLQFANLPWANMRWANLQGTNLQESNLQFANLQGANMRWANLQETNLQGTNLQESDLDFAGYELSCKTIGITADRRLVSQLLYHLCRMDVQACPEWDELRNDERVIALANQSHVIREHGLTEIEPLNTQEGNS